MSRIDRGIPAVGEVIGDTTLIIGVPGGGKTHNTHLARKLGYLPSDMVIYNLGTLLGRDLRKSGDLNGSKDLIRILAPDVVDRRIRIVAPKVVERAFVSPHPHGIICQPVYVQGEELVSLEDLYRDQIGKVRRIVLYMSHPDDIIERRKKGPRSRLVESADRVEAHQSAMAEVGIRLADGQDIEVIPYMSRPRLTPANLRHLAEAIRI